MRWKRENRTPAPNPGARATPPPAPSPVPAGTSTEKVTVTQMSALAADDPRWSMPAVACMRDGSRLLLPGRSLREAREEMRRDGDEDFWFGGINANDLAEFGVILPPGQEPAVDEPRAADPAVVAGLETSNNWADVYVAACGDVLSAANACLEAANKAVSARNKIAQHQNDGLPGTPIAIRNFTSWAEAAEQEFGPLYRRFAEACSTAKETAASFLAASENEPRAEVVLALNLSEDTLDQVATAKAILGANYGATPAAFIAGVQESNGLMENPTDEGNIYRPAPASASGERECPWCAETIKAAAVVCRFCGRDVQAQTNVG